MHVLRTAKVALLSLVLVAPLTGCGGFGWVVQETITYDTGAIDRLVALNNPLADGTYEVVDDFRVVGRAVHLGNGLYQMEEMELDRLLREVLRDHRGDAIVNLRITERFTFIDGAISVLVSTGVSSIFTALGVPIPGVLNPIQPRSAVITGEVVRLRQGLRQLEAAPEFAAAPVCREKGSEILCLISMEPR